MLKSVTRTSLEYLARLPADSWMLAILVTLSLGVTIELGGYSPAALDLVMIATLAAAMVVGGRLPRKIPGARGMRSAVIACAAMTARGATAFGESHGAVTLVAMLLLLVIGAAFCRQRSRVPLWVGSVALALIGLQAALGWHWGHGAIDVYGVVDTSAQRLVHGLNPYSSTVIGFQQPHPGANLEPVATHLPYLPFAVLAAVPASLLGDVRLTSLVAWLGLVSGLACIARRDQAEHSDRILLAAVWPFAPVMIVAAYVDMVALAALVGWVALRHRNRWVSVLLLGCGIAVKPLLTIALVVYLLRGGPSIRIEIVAAVAVAGLICLPFAVATGIVSFVRYTTLGFGNSVPPLDNALSVNSLSLADFGRGVPLWMVALLMLGALVLTFRRPIEDMADLAYASAFFVLVFVALSPYSFINYYQYPLVLVLMGICSRRESTGSTGRCSVQVTAKYPSTAPVVP